MLASVDRFLARRPDGDRYNCLHLADEIWFAHTGERLSDRLKVFHEPEADRQVRKTDVAAFTRLSAPQDPCLVLMRRPFGGRPHVGVFLRGKVLHLSERGARFERLDLARVGFSSVRFYK